MSPKSAKSLTKSHKFKLNPRFKDKRQRVLINIPIVAKSDPTDSPARRIIDEDRKMHIQAAIVRTMKARNTAKHSVLIAEVINQLRNRFKPKIPLIKKCIDILIEKEYVRRLEDQKDMYAYVA